MKILQRLIYSFLFVTNLSVYTTPALSGTTRQVIELSQKKYIKAEHIKGFDTYDNPIDYHIKEQYILRFKNRNGFFQVPKHVYEEAHVGDKFTTEDEQLYYCREVDNCYDRTL